MSDDDQPVIASK